MTTTTTSADAGTRTSAVTACDLHQILTEYCRRIPGLSDDELLALEQIVDASVSERGTWPDMSRVPQAAFIDLMLYTSHRCPNLSR